MAERAYSLELNEPISAKKASKLSCDGKLHDERQFQCNDSSCAIRLTCTNWGKSGKRYYFTPSSLNELHIIGCTEISPSEAKEQTKRESGLAKETIQKNGIIKMSKSVNKVASNIIATTEHFTVEKHVTNSLISNHKSTKEARHLYSIASFIDLYKDPTVDIFKQFVSIGDSKISLHDLFVSTTTRLSDLPYKKYRIFYGQALIRTATFGNDMLEIEFQNSEIPKIYSNITILSKRSNTSKLITFLDKEKVATVYFRGKLTNHSKFEPYNDKVYKDIYFE